MYGLSYFYWFIYGTNLDLPAVLGKLVGLGYEIGRATYRGGLVHLEPLPDGSAAKRVYEDGVVQIFADLNKGALGVYAESYNLVNRGVADLSRALAELSAPEPPRAELHISFGFSGNDCRSEKLVLAGEDFVKTGLVLVSGKPQGGEGIYILITPAGDGRYITYIVIGGGWQYTISRLKRAGDLINSLLALFNCK
ncbi:MAG: hypothetical protein QXI18_02100 [Nitrososphaerota archaeon]|uniref:AIG2-like family n=1 Tax=Pyrobaculum oguniense (strain DSM 13380 / JCM 10595 / TE7) TaxID=698757 RepID=H6Q8E0_PYROT|nr:hypothetical protein Pogu_0920 [Pyrobaculum oguniense TE7]